MAPGGDWSLADASTLQFDGDNGDYAYLLTVCLQMGELYNPYYGGQRVLIALYNVTDTPVLLVPATTSAVYYNHTDPSFVTGVCTSLPVSSVFEGTQLGVYAALERTDLSSGNAPLGVSTWTISATPLACKGVQININITANFNDSQLEEGDCIDITYPTAERIRVSNPGVCGVVVTDTIQASHSSESWWTHAWHYLKASFDATSTLTGTLVYQDTDHILPRHPSGSNVRWDWQCGSGISCGEDSPIETNDTCRCKEAVETEGQCNCELGVEATNGTCNCKNGVETEGTCTCESGVDSDGPVTAPSCSCTTIETTQIESPTGLPVNFPSGASFPPPVPITVFFDPNQPSVSSISTSSSSSSSSSSSTSSSGSGSSSSGSSGSSPGLPGSGGCGVASVFLKADKPYLIGIDPRTGRKVKLIGSVVSGASSAVSSAASSATSAAGSAAGAATSAATSVVSAITGILCDGPGVPTPAAAGGGVGSGSPSTPDYPDPADITGPVAAAAFGASTPSTTSTPTDTTAAAVAAAVAAAAGNPQLPPLGPTSITVWAGGLTIPVFNDSHEMPTCNTLYRGNFGVKKGNGTTDDKAVMCLNQPSKSGFGWYPFPTDEAIVTAVFSGNGTGLTCPAEDEWCIINAYPNGSLYSISPVDIITPGNCTFCSLSVDATGRVRAMTSSNVTIFNGSVSYDQTITYWTNAGIIMDNQSAIINQGETVLNQVLITDLNVTGTTRIDNLILSTPSTLTGCIDSGVATFSGTVTSGLTNIALPALPTTARCGWFRIATDGTTDWPQYAVATVTIPQSTFPNYLGNTLEYWDNGASADAASASILTKGSFAFSAGDGLAFSFTLLGVSIPPASPGYGLRVTWKYEPWEEAP
jgi:hypothetical protein